MSRGLEYAKRLELLGRAKKLALRMFKSDEQAADAWMHTPNAYFFNHTPETMCLMGEGEAVIDLLRLRMGS